MGHDPLALTPATLLGLIWQWFFTVHIIYAHRRLVKMFVIPKASDFSFSWTDLKQENGHKSFIDRKLLGLVQRVVFA